LARENSNRQLQRSRPSWWPRRLKPPRLLELPTFCDVRGALTAVESDRDIPFAIKRVYYLHDLPKNALRGGHVHLVEEEVLIPVHGQFTLVLDDGFERQAVRLSRASTGFYVPTMIWHELRDFTSDAACMVLASGHYDESDYCSIYEEFLELVRAAAPDGDWGG
jgi:dTDP-4-dehydrorhamnose 3,5-epimerase-like enzyme